MAKVDFWERVNNQRLPPLIISEIGSNFCGSLEFCNQSIYLSAMAGADCVKFQTFKSDEFLASKELKLTVRKDGKDICLGSQYEVFRSLELPYEWHSTIAEISHNHGVYFSSSAADIDSLKVIIDAGADFVKLSSEDLINPKILNACSGISLPLVISTGMAEEYEIDDAIDILTRHGKKNIIILHCVSAYPVELVSTNLYRLRKIRQRYPEFIIGYSDHSEGPFSAVAATAIGARLFEKHFTIHKLLQGPDHSMSADYGELREYVSAIKETFQSIYAGTDGPIAANPADIAYRDVYRRSCVAKVNINRGHVIQKDDIDFKRAGPNGIHPFDASELIGRIATSDIPADSQITMSLLNE